MASQQEPKKSPAGDTSARFKGAEPSSTGAHDRKTGLGSDDREDLAELEQAAEEAFEQVGKAADRLTESVGDAYRAGSSFVRENPGSTLLTSFVIGVILGALWSGNEQR